MKRNNEMCLFKINLNARYKDLFLIRLAKLHGVHIKKKSEEISSKTTDEEIVYKEKLKNLRSDLDNLFKKLDIKENDLYSLKIKESAKIKYIAKDSHEIINHLLEDINFYTNRYNELEKYIANTKIELEKIINIKNTYEFLEEIDLTRDNLSQLKNLNFEVYTTFTKNISILRSVFDFKDIPNLIYIKEISSDRTAFFIFYPKDHLNIVRERISLIHAEEVPILRKFLLSSGINFKRINNELELLENYLSKYENELQRIRHDNLLKFASINEVISNLEEYNWAASQFEEITLDRLSYKFFALQGFKKQIFKELTSTFKDEIMIEVYNIEKGGKITKEQNLERKPTRLKKKEKKVDEEARKEDSKIMIEVYNNEKGGKITKEQKLERKPTRLKKEEKKADEEARKEDSKESWDGLQEETPTMMSHNPIFRPFETLTKMYGTPSYSEIDPTAFLFFTFPFLFGIMFGDIGHGFVLVLSGLIGAIAFRKRSGGIYNFSWIIFWCGCWAMLGGLLYGEFFGTEEILGISLNPIPIPLPFGGSLVLYNPLNNVTTVFFVTIFVGIFHMNLGWLIQMVNFIKSSKKYKAFTESLMKIFFLDGAFYLVLIYRFNFSAWLAPPFPPVLFPLIPGLLLIILKPLGKIFGISYIKKMTYGELLSEGSMDTFETILSVPSNILSYIRLLALALAHVSLMLAIQAMISIIPGEGIFVQIIVIIGLTFGNIVVILLEGVLVFLNALRLNFYEFFFKFYEGRGIDFVPFILEERYSTITFEFEQRKDVISSEIEKEIESEKIRTEIEKTKNYITNEYL